MARIGYLAGLLLITLPLAGCLFLPDTTVPIKTLRYNQQGRSDTLLVMIPGMADDEHAFTDNGFIAELERRDIKTDVVSAHVHLGYLLEDSFVERIEQDIIWPAREKGYKHIWMVGISLGAFVAVNYMKERPGDVTGLILLGAFLGEEKDLKKIRAAGGILSWQPSDVELLPRTLRLWHWYQQRAKDHKLDNIYLAYGKSDHLLKSGELFSPLLPVENIYKVEGEHKWTTWSRLWRRVLDEVKLD